MVQLVTASDEMQRRGIRAYVYVGGRDCAVTIFKNGTIDLEGAMSMDATQALALADGLKLAANYVRSGGQVLCAAN